MPQIFCWPKMPLAYLSARFQHCELCNTQNFYKDIHTFALIFDDMQCSLLFALAKQVANKHKTLVTQEKLFLEWKPLLAIFLTTSFNIYTFCCPRRFSVFYSGTGNRSWPPHKSLDFVESN